MLNYRAMTTTPMKLTAHFILTSTFLSTLASAATGSATVTRDLSKMDKAVLAVQPKYSQTGSLESTVPTKMKAGQNGYLIATTEQIKNNSKELAAFIKHKESRGFKVHVATEKDWGLEEAGKGRKQADRVHQWMRDNYKELNLLYTLIIANPHPEEGMIPMAKFKPRKYLVPTPDQKKDYEKYLKYKDNPRTEDGKFLKYDGHSPSDYYYADLTSNWDANGNTILADKEDYASGEIDATVEVYVGRIPYYGEEHEYANLAGVDKILRRTIDYELDAVNDTSWRNNVFYVGGADKRFEAIQGQFIPFSGGRLETYRVSQGYGYEPTKDKWSNAVITGALNQDRPFGFINFQEHGSPTSMAGQIGTRQAVTLKRTKPAYVYLGGCDVASPEHSNNITGALFNHIGVAAVGASRSVTGVGGDDDTKTQASYERLFFGQSTGEAHWQMLSDFGDGMKKVGASNFLMNLMGDPSVVIFPKTDENPLVIGPNMDVLKFRHQERNQSTVMYPMTVRNQTGEAQEYKVATSGVIAAETKSFRLPPYTSRTLKVAFKGADKLSVGQHEGSLMLKTGNTVVERKFELDVYARNLLLSQSFDTMESRKIFSFAAKGDKLDQIVAFTEEHAADTWLTVPSGNRGDLARTKLVVGESDVTIAARLMYEESSKRLTEILRFGKTFTGFIATVEGNNFTVQFTSTEGIVGEEVTATIEVPAPPAGEWFTMIASVDRVTQTATLNIDGKTKSVPFKIEPGQSLALDRVRVANNKNKTNVMVDELTVFDYNLNEKELASVVSGDIIKQNFPKNGDKANPKGVNLAWNYAGKQSEVTYVLAYATDPQFKDRKFIETKASSTLLRGLKKDTTYFWMVGYLKNGKMFFPWDSYSTFITDSSIKDAEVEINKRRSLSTATVGDNNFTENLGKVAKAFYVEEGSDKRKRADLFFAKIDGAEWLRCHSDGTLTTNFGAPKPGEYKFKFSVSTRYGVPQTFEKTIIAK